MAWFLLVRVLFVIGGHVRGRADPSVQRRRLTTDLASASRSAC